MADPRYVERERLKQKQKEGQEKPTTVVGDPKAGKRQQAAETTEAVTSDLSSGKAAKGGGADMPKQQSGEDPAAFGERLRKWREAQRNRGANQAKALGGS